MAVGGRAIAADLSEDCRTAFPGAVKCLQSENRSPFTQGKPVAQWVVPQWQGQQFYEPYLAFDQNGLLYASSAPSSSVIVFGSDGEQENVVTDAEGVALQMPAGLAVSSTNVLYIADRGSSEVYTTDLGPVTGAEAVTSLPVASPAGSPQASPVASPQASPVASPSASG